MDKTPVNYYALSIMITVIELPVQKDETLYTFQSACQNHAVIIVVPA